MAQPAWEDFGAPSETKTAPTAAPAWEDFGATDSASAPTTRSFGQRLSDEFKGATATGFPGLLARKTYDWFNINKPEGISEEQHDAAIAQAQRDILAEAQAKADADPTWRPDETWAQNLLSTRWPATVLGMGGGSAGPEMALNPGASAEARIASQAGISGAADLGYQLSEKADNVRDDVSLAQAGASALFGGGFQGLNEIGSALVKSIKGETPVKWKDEEEFQNATRNLLADPKSTRADFDALSQHYGRDPFGDDLDAVLANRGAPVNVVTGQQTPEGYHSTVEPGKLAPSVEKVVQHLDENKGKWTNAPNVKVDKNFDAIDGVDNGALGFYDPETGRVNLNADAISEEALVRGITPGEMTNTVMFHEGLGHYGLAQKFRDDLDYNLQNFYDNSKWFKKKTDEWIAKNPNQYIDDDTVVRAGEEVLAEMSEKGQLPTGIFDRFKNTVKKYAREAGINLNFSEREIKTILSQAHAAVVSGAKADVIGNGFRTMRRKLGESEGTLQGATVSEDLENAGLGPVRSNRIIDPVLRNNEAERFTRSWDEDIDAAERLKMTRKAAENLSLGIEVPEYLAAKKKGIESANRIVDLTQKSKNMTLSPKEWSILEREQDSLARIMQAISDVRAEIGRMQNANKIEVGSDKALSERLLTMMAHADLSTPEKVAKFNDFVDKEKISSKKKEAIKKFADVFHNIMQLPRSLMSSTDFSAPFRQGVFLVGRKEFWKNMPEMFKYAFNKEFFDQTMMKIENSKNFPLMERAGLAFTDMGDNLSKREEAFMSSYAEKIPFIGHLVKGSERAYSGFLNKVRADTFDSIAKLYDDAGVNLRVDKKAAKDIAKFINNATGRGDLGKFDHAAVHLSSLLFSPRLIASRLRLLYPGTYIGLDPIVRKEALKSLASFSAIASTGVGLLAMAGANVETNPTSSDFAKARFGDTRYDLFGGFQQYLTLGARLFSNMKKNAKGDVETLGEKFGSDDAWDVLGNFVRSKLSPNASFVVNARTGKNIVGEEFNIKKDTAELFIPMFLKDASELISEHGATGAAMAVPGLFGISTQEYPGPKGTDVYGRSYEAEREDTPGVTEMKRLEEVNGKPVVNPPRKQVGDRLLTEDEFNQYQELAGKWITESVEQEMRSPDWQNYSDEEKTDIIKDIAKDMRANARDQLFSGEEADNAAGQSSWESFK